MIENSVFLDECRNKLKNAEMSWDFIDDVPNEIIYLDNDIFHEVRKINMMIGLAMAIRSLRKDLGINERI